MMASAAELDLGRELKRCILDAEEQTAAEPGAEKPPGPPPIEVEMRLIPPPRSCDKWGWECRLADLWILGSYNDRDLYFPRDYEAKASGEAWLTALSKQLGIKLVANWEGEL